MSADYTFNEDAFAEMVSDPDGPVAHDLERRAILVESAAKRLLSQPGSGRVYQRYRPRRTHRASAPGQAPAVDTGLLRASITHRLDHDGQGLYAEVGTDVKYAIYQELGTRRIEPRPFLRPALDAADG